TNAGTLQMLSPQQYIRGSMLANTVAGPFQRQSPPIGGTLIVGDNKAAPSGSTKADYRAPSVVLADGSQDGLGGSFDPLTSALPATALSQAAFSPAQLTQNGFNNFGIYSNGTVTLPAGSSVTLAGGSFTVNAQAVQIDGRISGAG